MKKHYIIVTGLTIFVSLLWGVSVAVRILNPDLQFTSLDAAALVVIGYWFTVASRKNGVDTK